MAPQTYAWENTAIDDNFLNSLTSAVGGSYDINKKLDETGILKTFFGGLDDRVSSQNLGNVTTYVNKLNSYVDQKFNTTAEQLKAAGIDVNQYLDPSYKLYNAGEGAASNRNSIAINAALQASAKMSALQAAQQALQAKQSGQTVVDPGIMTKYQQQLAQAEAQVAANPRNMDLQLYRDRLKEIVSGQAQNTTAMQAANAAAARVGAPVKAGVNISGDSNGGLFQTGQEAQAFYNKETGQLNQPALQQYTQYEQAGIANPNGPSYKATTSTSPTAQGSQGAMDLIKEILIGGADLNNLQNNAFWSSNKNKVEAYPLLQEMFKDPTKLAQFVYSNGIQNLQDLPWWKNLPKAVKDSAWQQIQAMNAQASGVNPNDATQNLADSFNQWANTTQENLLNGAEDDIPGTNNSSSTEDDYLNDLINGLQGEPTTTQTTSTATPGGAPEVFSAEQKLQQLRQEQGIDPLEGEVADIDAEINALKTDFQAARDSEEGKKVSLGVIGNRISEQERVYNQRINQLNDQKSVLTTQLNQKYNVVNTMMAAAQTDYNNAVQAYDSQFTKSLQMANLLMSKTAADKTAANQIADNARANFTVVANAISAGSLKWEDLSAATQASYQKMELQAGLPSGTLQAFAQKPSKDWSMQTVLPGVDENGNQIATIIEKNAVTGEFKTSKLVTDYAPKPTSSSSNIVQKGTRVDGDGNDVAWQLDKDGNLTETVLGKSKTVDKQNIDDQNKLSDFMLDIAKQRTKQNAYGEPVLTREGAIQQILAKYPGASQDQINYILGEY